MPGSTPIYGFPYPLSTDLVANYPAVGLELATDVETALAAASVIKQVVFQSKTDTFSASVTGNGGESGDFISASITPASTANKVLVIVSANVSGTESGLFLRTYRGSTRIYQGDTASNRQRVSASTRAFEQATPMSVSYAVLDSPAASTATTYNVRISHQATATQTVYLNRGTTDSDTAPTPRTASSLILIEVKG